MQKAKRVSIASLFPRSIFPKSYIKKQKKGYIIKLS